jgi:hypothetical protein
MHTHPARQKERKMPGRKYQKYFVTELQIPESKQKIAAQYAKYATRVLWLDDKVVEGAFHMNCAWYLHPAQTLEDTPHTHDTDEIIGFFGSDPQKPNDLGGEIEFWMEDEKYTLTKSTLIFVPSGLKHCPLVIKKVDRPIFHFTTVTGGQYNKELKTAK